MPFYEYECPACKYYTEVMQKISDAPLTKCPSCGKRGMKKLVSAPVFRLKGAGWYETDFKSDKENKRNLHGPDKEETKAQAKEAKETKAEGKESKEAKEVKETKPTEPKAPADAGSAKTTRGRSSVSVKPAASTGSRRRARPTRSGNARKHRR
jgi:putative FmdB family regulatory protein